MTQQTHAKPPRPEVLIPAEEVFRAIDDEDAALPPATAEALQAAFKVIGNEMVRREVLARRAGDERTAKQLIAALWAFNFAQSVMSGETRFNDFLRDAEDLREDLATLPPSDPDDDDAWVLKDG